MPRIPPKKRRTRIPRALHLVALGLLFLQSACGSSGGLAGEPTVNAGPPGSGPPAASTDAAVTSVTPTALDRDHGGTLTLVGAELRAPLEVRLVDDEGTALFAPLSGAVSADATRATLEVPALEALGTDVRCVLRIRNGDGRAVETQVTVTLTREFRTVDGTGNNAGDTTLGSAGVALRRALPPAYADGRAALAGADRPNPRAISNLVCAREGDQPAAQDASGFLWQWGQFVDHDIVLTAEADPEEPAPITIPLGDPEFDPFFTGEVQLSFHRSAYVIGSEPRQQRNEITSWIDGSVVYGSDRIRAEALRTRDGTGRLRTSEGDLLPFNTEGLPNAGGTDASLFLGGDVRANEQIGLTTLHTLFVREHNRLAAQIRSDSPELGGDEIYEEARRLVAAQIQAITYQEFLPLLLGPNAMPAYSGYDPTVDADLSNVFATAAYRFGHSLLPTTILRLDAQGNEIGEGHLSLRDAFFHPELLATEGGLEPILRGLAAAPSQALDAFVVEDVRSFLFGPPGAGGLDLAALNLQRGRDHGLAAYGDVRAAFDLSRPGTFDDLTSDADTATRLENAYVDVEHVDAWIGALAEDTVPGALVGPLLRRILAEEFRRLRDGDRFFYERALSGAVLEGIRNTRLGDIIRRNTAIDGEIAQDVFRVGGSTPTALNVTAQPLTQEREGRLRDWRGAPPRPR